MKTLIMRIIGVLNLLFGLMGVYYFIFMMRMHWHNWPGSPSITQWAVFLVLSLISIGMLVYLGYLGIRLVRRDESALRPLIIIFISEILYFIVGVVVLWLIMPPTIKTIAVSFWGMAQDPLTPQVLTGYPLIGTVVTFVLMNWHPKSRRVAGGPGTGV
jgi:succinate dehydrogenase hydrophobic anchor subunit